MIEPWLIASVRARSLALRPPPGAARHGQVHHADGRRRASQHDSMSTPTGSFPKNYLKTIKRTGLGKALFAEMRYDAAGRENPEFVLNKGPFRKATILVAGENFGCGSSREHAPVGAARFRHPLRDRAVLRRHLLQQHLQERHPAHHPARGARQRAAALPARAAGRRDHRRPAEPDRDADRTGRSTSSRSIPSASIAWSTASTTSASPCKRRPPSRPSRPSPRPSAPGSSVVRG